MPRNEQQEQEAAGIELAASIAWECPCGKAPPCHPNAASPVRTLVSLREPSCPFCGTRYRDDYRVAS